MRINPAKTVFVILEAERTYDMEAGVLIPVHRDVANALDLAFVNLRMVMETRP